MRFSRPLALVALLLLVLDAHGDDVITEVMSPIASYHFVENYQTDALANGGIASPFISYHYAEDFSMDSLASGGAVSPFVSFQYLENFTSAALGNRCSIHLSYGADGAVTIAEHDFLSRDRIRVHP